MSISSTRLAHLAAASVLALSSFGCASIPPPRIVAEADEVAASKRAMEAKSLAPSAFAHAEKLRGEAHAALLHDRAAHAQMLAEQAIAAYEEASALARVARAQRAEQVALAEADKSDAELAAVEAELGRARAEADALETRLKVTRDAQPITPSGPASAGREEARKQAARAMAVQAKLLCTAAKLLGPVAATPKAEPPKVEGADKVPGGVDPTTPESIARDLASAEADLDKLDAALAGQGPTPIDLATRVRARCMSSLTHVRRANASAQKAPGAGDALLQELAAYASRDGSGLNPGRDERGVTITLSRAFDGESLSSGAAAKLADLDRVAASHPDFAVAVVLHSDKPLGKADEERWKARADKLSAAFKSVSKGRISTLVAGNNSPLVDPHGKDKAKNLRVEIVFVSPEAL